MKSHVMLVILKFPNPKLFKAAKRYSSGAHEIQISESKSNRKKSQNKRSKYNFEKLAKSIHEIVINISVRIQARNTQLLRYQVHNNLMINKLQA